MRKHSSISGQLSCALDCREGNEAMEKSIQTGLSVQDYIKGHSTSCLGPLIFSVIEEQKPFDIDTYKHLLKKYKTRNPEKLFDLLDKESRLYPFNS